MSAYGVLLFLSAVSLVWAVVSALCITAALDRRGAKTPFPFLRARVLSNVSRYRHITRRETGKVGPLFYSYVISINAVWILALAALAARAWR